MRKLLYLAFILLGIGILSSCEKLGDAGLKGTWDLSTIEVYYDGKLIDTVKDYENSDAYFLDTSVGRMEVGILTLFIGVVQISFTSDGKVSSWGMSVPYSIENGVVIVNNNDSGLRYNNGKLTYETTETDYVAYVDSNGQPHIGSTFKLIGHFKKQ